MKQLLKSTSDLVSVLNTFQWDIYSGFPFHLTKGEGRTIVLTMDDYTILRHLIDRVSEELHRVDPEIEEYEKLSLEIATTRRHLESETLRFEKLREKLFSD